MRSVLYFISRSVVFVLLLMAALSMPAVVLILFLGPLSLLAFPERTLVWMGRRHALRASSAQAVVIYDGQCGFCRRGIAALEVMDLFGRVRALDYHKARPEDLPSSLTSALAHSQLHLLEFQGRLSGGFFAFRRLCHLLSMLYPWLALLYAPGMGTIGPAVYRWVAKNRYLFHKHHVCQDKACFREE